MKICVLKKLKEEMNYNNLTTVQLTALTDINISSYLKIKNSIPPMDKN